MRRLFLFPFALAVLSIAGCDSDKDELAGIAPYDDFNLVDFPKCIVPCGMEENKVYHITDQEGFDHYFGELYELYGEYLPEIDFSVYDLIYAFGWMPTYPTYLGCVLTMDGEGKLEMLLGLTYPDTHPTALDEWACGILVEKMNYSPVMTVKIVRLAKKPNTIFREIKYTTTKSWWDWDR
ncbi:MAG: hypothetical protein LUE26_12445 [Alistipes sp.]|nr:hypothetical protein [Alistipes sp.]